MLVAEHLCRSCFWSNTRPACTGRSPQNSNNPITHSPSLPLSRAMQAALFWGSVGKILNRERTARSRKPQKTGTHHAQANAMALRNAQPWNGRSPLHQSHWIPTTPRCVSSRTWTEEEDQDVHRALVRQCMPHASATHDDTRRNLPNAPSTTPENQVLPC